MPIPRGLPSSLTKHVAIVIFTLLSLQSLLQDALLPFTAVKIEFISIGFASLNYTLVKIFIVDVKNNNSYRLDLLKCKGDIIVTEALHF